MIKGKGWTKYNDFFSLFHWSVSHKIVLHINTRATLGMLYGHKAFSLGHFASEHDFHDALVLDKLRDMTEAGPLANILGELDVLIAIVA